MLLFILAPYSYFIHINEREKSKKERNVGGKVGEKVILYS